MKKRVFAALMAGVMGTMMFGTTFVSAEAETPELKGEVYAFIAYVPQNPTVVRWNVSRN